MQIERTDDAYLAQLGEDAARLVRTGDYATLVERFGYALAFGRELATAVRNDVRASLAEVGDPPISDKAGSVVVKYFPPNAERFVALIECDLPLVANAGTLLVELIVLRDGATQHVTLEQISVVVR